MKLAFFTPLPPTPTGVADYSLQLLEYLADRIGPWELAAFTEKGEVPPETAFACYRAEELPQWSSGDSVLPVYQMGNSPHHDFIYRFAFRHPGIVVLHDLVLHHARLAAYLASPELAAYRADLGDPAKKKKALSRLEDYVAEVRAVYPKRGAAIAEIALRTGGGRLLYAYPLYGLLVRANKMTLVHNHAARQEVARSCPGSEVRSVRMGVALPAVVDRSEARRRLGLPCGILLASFGLVTPEKRISLALHALRRLVDEGIDATYYLVGGSVAHFDALERAQELGVGQRVHLTGRVSEEEFWLYAFASDICLNLRYPSAGETSATLLRLLAAGRAVLVTDQATNLDFPDDVAHKVSLAGDEDGLYCDLKALIGNVALRSKLEAASRRFVATEHSMEAMAKDYMECIKAARELPPGRAKLPPHLRA